MPAPQRDGRRLGTLLCCHLGLLFVFPALSLACIPSLALLGIPLVLRAVPVSQGWYQARRGAVVALVLCALVLHASAHVLPALRALPREAERERLLKAAHLWMLGVGWSLQVRRQAAPGVGHGRVATHPARSGWRRGWGLGGYVLV